MKKLLQSYLNFTRTERRGVLALLILLGLLIAVRMSMPYWYSGKVVANTRPHGLVSNAPPTQNSGATDGAEAADEPQTATADAESTKQPELFYFNPNTADSSQLRRLGFSAFQARNLIKWRAKGKRFYKPQDLRPLYGMTGEQYNRLAPYIRIDAEVTLKLVDLNSADSMALLSIRGIGPRLAHRILERRRQHGPYTSHAQLLEVYHFSDSMYRQLQKQLIIAP